MASGTLTSNPDQVAVDAPTPTTVAPSADDLPPDNTTAVA